MKLTTSVLLALLASIPSARAGSDLNPPNPSVDVEIVWTDVMNGWADFFLLVTNPNDFNVYVGRCWSVEIQHDLSGIVGWGTECRRPEDFSLLAAKARRVSQLLRRCPLVSGPNRFHVELTSSMSGDLPWNYVVPGNREFDFVIDKPDTLPCARADSDLNPPKPSIDVEIVRADVLNGKVDLFVLITNPNDFDVHVGRCGSAYITYGRWASYRCGSVCNRPEDFRVLAAKARRVSWLRGGCLLTPGPNKFHVELTSGMSGDFPWNYVVSGEREFDFVIVNPDTLSR